MMHNIAILVTSIMASFGWAITAAGVALLQQRPPKKVWQYGFVGFVAGIITTGVSFWH